ncbi:TPA: hypothetical protein ACIAIH_001400 [Enterobacter bugandensis]
MNMNVRSVPEADIKICETVTRNVWQECAMLKGLQIGQAITLEERFKLNVKQSSVSAGFVMNA